MNYLPKTQTLMASALLLVSTCSFATPYKPNIPIQKAPANNYVGASIGQLYENSGCDEFARCDTDSMSWKVYSGVRVTKNLMLEGGYIKFGEANLETTEGLKIDTNLSGYTVAGVATYQHNDKVELFGKAGAFWSDLEADTTLGDFDKSDTNGFFGLGANYDLGDNLGLKAEWERFVGLENPLDNEKNDIDLISLGVTFSSL